METEFFPHHAACNNHMLSDEQTTLFNAQHAQGINVCCHGFEIDSNNMQTDERGRLVFNHDGHTDEIDENAYSAQSQQHIYAEEAKISQVTTVTQSTGRDGQQSTDLPIRVDTEIQQTPHQNLNELTVVSDSREVEVNGMCDGKVSREQTLNKEIVTQSKRQLSRPTLQKPTVSGDVHGNAIEAKIQQVIDAFLLKQQKRNRRIRFDVPEEKEQKRYDRQRPRVVFRWQSRGRK